MPLDRQVEPVLDRFEKAMEQFAEVMECYLMTGDSGYPLEWWFATHRS